MVGEDYKTKFAGSLFVLIVLCTHCIFVHGRGLPIHKNNEIDMHEGTVKIIESDVGDVIECVEINKQPAFNHPLLRNHTIQMKPSGPSGDNKNPMLIQSWHKNGECPEGTIPIIRTQKIKYPPRSTYPKMIPQPNQTFEFGQLSPRPEYAFVTLTGDNFYGAHTFSNVWHPATYNDEYSIAQIWVIAGNANDQDHFDALEVGWVVTEGDDLTRLFIHWTSDGYQKTGCFNIDCPGFVLIDRSFAFGGALTPDNESGNWWVGVAERILGYWPGLLFTGLADHATAVILGGELLNKNVDGHHTTTQMGSGHFPEGPGKASYFANTGYYNEIGNFVIETKLIPSATKSSCYDVKIVEHTNGTYFYYGGPGFSFNCL
ncbi:hypothetical protein ACOSP7_020266 [Xanthoceras sorbifolium]